MKRARPQDALGLVQWRPPYPDHASMPKSAASAILTQSRAGWHGLAGPTMQWPSQPAGDVPETDFGNMG